MDKKIYEYVKKIIHEIEVTWAALSLFPDDDETVFALEDLVNVLYDNISAAIDQHCGGEDHEDFTDRYGERVESECGHFVYEGDDSDE